MSTKTLHLRLMGARSAVPPHTASARVNPSTRDERPSPETCLRPRLAGSSTSQALGEFAGQDPFRCRFGALVIAASCYLQILPFAEGQRQ
jgi:hypothetical protein